MGEVLTTHAEELSQSSQAQEELGMVACICNLSAPAEGRDWKILTSSWANWAGVCYNSTKNNQSDPASDKVAGED